MVWVRYWESRGVSEETQMDWAAHAEAEDADGSANPSQGESPR